MFELELESTGRSCTQNIIVDKITTNERDAWFLMHNGSFACVTEILGEEMFLCNIVQCRHLNLLFSKPCHSDNLDILVGTNQVSMKRKTVSKSDFCCKVVRMQKGASYVYIPVAHTANFK